jgi:hypothetical protein
MKDNIARRKCDCCGKVVEQAYIQFGGSPFNGRLSVTRTDGSTCLPLRDNGPWDFCSTECLAKFLKIDKEQV